MFRTILALSLSVILVSRADACDLPRAKPVWIAHDDDSTLVLVGSVHRLAPGEFAVPAAAADINRASRVYFESRPLSMFGTVRAALRGRSDAPLKTLLPAEDWTRVETLGRRLGVGRTILERLDPFLLAGYLQEKSLSDEDGRTSAHGVDAQLRHYARTRRADVRYLEDRQQLLTQIDALPLADKLSFLMTAVEEIERGETNATIDLWLTGDLCTLDAVAHEMATSAGTGEAMEPIYRLLVADRNRRFTEAAVQALNEPGLHVMVVGALHLVGPESVVSQLRAREIEIVSPSSDD